MIDLHSHILPNIDDGAESVEESIKILEDAFSQGIELCVATSHCKPHSLENVDNFLKNRESAFFKLKNKLSGNKKVPKIILGAEVYLDGDISEYGEELLKKLCIQDTNVMLIEFPTNTRLRSIQFDRIYALNSIGICPLIAHVSRYDEPLRVIKELSYLDVFYQINANDFLHFSKIRKLAKYFDMTSNFVVSSDVHNMTHRRNEMLKAYKKAQKKYPDMVEYLFEINAKRLIYGEK